MSGTRLTLETINALDEEAFVAHLGPVFERSPWVARTAWASRPFASLEDLHRALRAAVDAAPPERQQALIRAHPDLAGRLAVAGELTAESAREQASAGLDRLSPEEFAEFTRLNQAYRERFGFPFVICVRDHSRESILAAFRARLANSEEQEVATALREIARIAELRLRDLVAPAPAAGEQSPPTQQGAAR